MLRRLDLLAFVEVLTACKFNVAVEAGLDLTIRTEAGIFVMVKPNPEETVPTMAFVISLAFNNAGLTTQFRSHPNFSTNQVRIFVGTKPNK